MPAGSNAAVGIELCVQAAAFGFGSGSRSVSRTAGSSLRHLPHGCAYEAGNDRRSRVSDVRGSSTVSGEPDATGVLGLSEKAPTQLIGMNRWTDTEARYRAPGRTIRAPEVFISGHPRLE